MGLFWSMTADPGQQKGSRYLKRDVTTPQVVNLSVFEDHYSWSDCHNISQEPLVSSEVERWFLHKSVKREVIRDGILRGTLFTPSGILLILILYNASLYTYFIYLFIG